MCVCVHFRVTSKHVITDHTVLAIETEYCLSQNQFRLYYKSSSLPLQTTIPVTLIKVHDKVRFAPYNNWVRKYAPTKAAANAPIRSGVTQMTVVPYKATREVLTLGWIAQETPLPVPPSNQ